MSITVSPAYGRDYKSRKAVEAAWIDGEDFQIQSVHSGQAGRYMSIRDVASLVEEGHDIVELRYKKMTQVTLVKIEAPNPVEVYEQKTIAIVAKFITGALKDASATIVKTSRPDTVIVDFAGEKYKIKITK